MPAVAPDRVVKAKSTISRLGVALGETVFVATINELGLDPWLSYNLNGRLTLSDIPDIHMVTLAAALGAIAEANPHAVH